MTDLRAPFPYFGGKSRVAPVVWQAFSDRVPQYVETHAGSLAVLLGRPGWAGKIETVNDADGLLVNFWRSVQLSPDETAKWADWPISEIDVHARHAWLLERKTRLREFLVSDPEAHDPKAAGWWVWGICQWIGGGWGSHPSPGRKVALCPPRGVFKTKLPSLGNDKGIHGVSAPPAHVWFNQLRERLRGVRIVSGDWSRVVTDGALGFGDNVGGRHPCALFLDPPYVENERDRGCYAVDSDGIAASVGQWALEHGSDARLRIALCGYEGNYDLPGWTEYSWKPGGGYHKRGTHGFNNRQRERIWFSPHCLQIGKQGSLFGD